MYMCDVDKFTAHQHVENETHLHRLSNDAENSPKKGCKSVINSNVLNNHLVEVSESTTLRSLYQNKDRDSPVCNFLTGHIADSERLH